MINEFIASSVRPLWLFFCSCRDPISRAQKEFPPPQGKGRVVVVSSGASGPEHYETGYARDREARIRCCAL